MARKTTETREYKQKFFAGERVFVYLAIAFGVALFIQAVFGGINWIDVGLFVIYLAVMVGFTAYSAYYPDVIVGPGGFSYRIFIRYKKVQWDSVRKVTAYPEDLPTAILLTIGEERRRKLLLRRKAIDGFDDMIDNLARYVPGERWFGFEYEEDEEDDR